MDGFVRLTWTDLGRLRRTVEAFHERAIHDDVADAYLAAVQALVPGDVVIVAMRPELWEVRCSDPVALERSADVTAEDMVSHPAISRRFGGAVAVSDFLVRAQWERTACYQKCFRQLGLEDDLGVDVMLEPGTPVVQACVMRAWRNFSAEERALLTLLAAHVPAACREAQGMMALRGAVADAVGGTMIVVNARRRITDWSRETRALVAGVFNQSVQSTRRLPTALQEWLALGAKVPLVVNRRGQHTTFRFVAYGRGGGLVTVQQSNRPAAVADERLTLREREVLGWAVGGLHNPEIAGRLGIAPGTVKRHLENAFAKLGVRGRVEAAAALNTQTLPHSTAA